MGIARKVSLRVIFNPRVSQFYNKKINGNDKDKRNWLKEI